MEILAIIIFIIIAIGKASAKETPKPVDPTSRQAYEMDHGTQMQRTTASRSSYSRPSDEEAWKKSARESLEKVKQRATAVAKEVVKEVMADEGVKSPETEDMTAAERIRTRRMEERNTTILERAKGNAYENKEDVTLNTMEAEHQHSERVSAAVHHHPEDVIPENMLGSIEDLMVKGYDGNLCFERDFVGEAMDMISRFTVPSDVPDYSDEKAS